MSLKDYLRESHYTYNKQYLLPDLNGEGKSKEELMNQHKEKILKSERLLVLHDWRIWDSVKEEIEFANLNWVTVEYEDIRLTTRISEYQWRVNPNLKQNILNNLIEWNLLRDFLQNEEERKLTLDEILAKYSEGDREYKDQTLFNFDVIDNKIYFSTWSVAPLAWGGQTIIYQIEDWKVVKKWVYSVWMS